MKYWVAYDDRQRKDDIVAFHEDKEIVQNYIDSVRDVTYKLGRCKSSELKKITDIGDLYLVRYLDTYVQCKFYNFLDDVWSADLHDFRQAVDTLDRILRLNDLQTSDRKAIVKTVAYLKGLIIESEETVPDYDFIRREYNEFELQREQMLWHDALDTENTDKYLQEDSSSYK